MTDCTCQIVGWTRDPAEPHIAAQPEWEQADDCPVHPMTTWRPGDRARVLFRDGERRPAELTAGFVWVSLDGNHSLNAVGGFDAEPILTLAPAVPTCDHDWQAYWDGSLGYSATEGCKNCGAYQSYRPNGGPS